MKIALDAMGGDFGPPNLVAGAVMALRDYPYINKLFLVGDSERIEAELKKHGCNDSRIEITHATQVVDMSDRAWSAVRRKKDSSVSRAFDLVKHGDADAVVSAGHTGASVAAGTIKLRTLPGIDRPGIAAVLPTETNVFVLIDAGANIDARPEHLLQYAFMGSVYSRHVLHYKNPTVGLVSLSCRVRRIHRQRDLENVRIDRGGDVSMAQARAHAYHDEKGRRVPREKCHWNNQGQDEL